MKRYIKSSERGHCIEIVNGIKIYQSGDRVYIYRDDKGKNIIEFPSRDDAYEYIVEDKASDDIVESSQSERPYVVTFGWDEGGPESGPIWRSGTDIVYAISKEDACNKWESEYIDQFSDCAYEGCWAREATDADVSKYEAEMKQLDDEYNWMKEQGFIDDYDYPIDSSAQLSLPAVAVKKIQTSADVEDTDYSGYCHYTAGNSTWEWDARRRLHELGCAHGYVKFPRESGGYYRPSIVYMFDSKDTYDEFKQMLAESNLDWHVKLDKYREMPEGVIIIEED